MRETDPVQRVMFVAAHPDDADVRAGGTIAKWAAAGKEITYIIATSGNRGGDGTVGEDELAEIREQEQRAAAAVLGVREVRFLGHEDGYLTPSLELRKDITREIRRSRPQVVITHNPVRHYGWGNHPDHFAVGEATFAAIYPTARNPMAYPELAEEGLEPWEVTWSMAIDAESPDHFEDVVATLDIKVAAISRHASQYGEEYLTRVPFFCSLAARHAAEAGYPGLSMAEAFKLRFEGHPSELASRGHKVPG